MCYYISIFSYMALFSTRNYILYNIYSLDSLIYLCNACLLLKVIVSQVQYIEKFTVSLILYHILHFPFQFFNDENFCWFHFLEGLMYPSPKIVLNLLWTFKMLTLKENHIESANRRIVLIDY